MQIKDPLVWAGREPQRGPVAGLLRAMAGVPARKGKAWAGLVTMMFVAATWITVVLTQGALPELADLGYAVAIFAGVFFGAPGGIVAAIAVAVLTGPFAPFDAGLSLGNWLIHSAIAIGLGGVAGAWNYQLDRGHRRVLTLSERLSTTYQKTLHQIAEAIELRDPITAGHSRRVALNARTLGERMGFVPPELDHLYWAGLLHDVGKIAVPETILQKLGPLDTAEWSVMRAHSQIGAHLISETSPDLIPIATAVCSHHECWDGTGYPSGLIGQDIPINSRIISVVDVFDALTSYRPYRPALNQREALSYILERSGTQFDPSIVGTFKELIDESALVIAAPPETPASAGQTPRIDPRCDAFALG